MKATQKPSNKQKSGINTPKKIKTANSVRRLTLFSAFIKETSKLFCSGAACAVCLRSTVKFSVCPGTVFLKASIQIASPLKGTPLIATMRSPFCKPARSDSGLRVLMVCESLSRMKGGLVCTGCVTRYVATPIVYPTCNVAAMAKSTSSSR